MANVYYKRVLSDRMIDIIKDPKYSWIIDYVKEHPELDFQTGSNANGTWFSVYRGTGRVLSISPNRSLSAADAYKNLLPEFYTEDNLTPDNFDKLLSKISINEKLGRYYINDKGVKKEGYYQGLIGRRYTIGNINKDNDEFIIIDKEFVIGFKDKTDKSNWNKPIENEILELINAVRAGCNDETLPQNIACSYGEFDFLGLTWDGDIIIMELKQDDSVKTYLSPLQIAYYNKQLTKLQEELQENLYQNIKEMIEQKRDLGILNIPKALPEKFSGRILNYLIVGEEDRLSTTICNRFKKIRDIVGLKIEVFTCDQDGKLIPGKKLK